jgi:integrase
VEQRPENNARIRFLSDDEETIVRAVITKRCPKHMEEFDIALNSGMRKGEQYSLEWPEVHFKRKRIKLDETKNGSSREIPMNKTCLTAFETLYSRRPHNGRVCQSKFGEDLNDSRSWFEAVIEEAAENMPSLERFTWHCLRHTFTVLEGTPIEPDERIGFDWRQRRAGVDSQLQHAIDGLRTESAKWVS